MVTRLDRDLHADSTARRGRRHPRARPRTAGLLAAAGLYLVNPNTTHVPLCPLHAVTGLWCPLCGATRASYALVHGQLGDRAARQPAVRAAAAAAGARLVALGRAGPAPAAGRLLPRPVFWHVLVLARGLRGAAQPAGRILAGAAGLSAPVRCRKDEPRTCPADRPTTQHRSGRPAQRGLCGVRPDRPLRVLDAGGALALFGARSGGLATRWPRPTGKDWTADELDHNVDTDAAGTALITAADTGDGAGDGEVHPGRQELGALALRGVRGPDGRGVLQVLGSSRTTTCCCGADRADRAGALAALVLLFLPASNSTSAGRRSRRLLAALFRPGRPRPRGSVGSGRLRRAALDLLWPQPCRPSRARRRRSGVAEPPAADAELADHRVEHRAGADRRRAPAAAGQVAPAARPNDRPARSPLTGFALVTGATAGLGASFAAGSPPRGATWCWSPGTPSG